MVVSLLPLLLAVSTLAQTKRDKYTSEYKIKGVLLEKFVDFIDWPDGSDISDKSKPFVICVIGENPFVVVEKGKKTTEDWINKLYSNKKINDKKVEVRTISETKDIQGCELLFISKSEKKKLNEIISIAKKNYVLTISDSAGFVKKGVHINFYVERGNPKFEVNETALRNSGFRASYHMLKLAKIINPWKERR